MNQLKAIYNDEKEEQTTTKNYYISSILSYTMYRTYAIQALLVTCYGTNAD